MHANSLQKDKSSVKKTKQKTVTYRLKLSLVIFWKVTGLVHVRLIKGLLKQGKQKYHTFS